MKHAATLTLAAVAALGLAGCRTRTLQIESDPPGALVWLNDEQVGRTPLEVGYIHQGTYDVRVRLEGYVPLLAHQSTSSSVEDVPGVDFVTQAIPGDARTVWFFKLDPLPESIDRKAAEAALVERAKSLRDHQAAAVATPAAKKPDQPKGDAGTPATVEPSATSPSTTAPAPTTAK